MVVAHTRPSSRPGKPRVTQATFAIIETAWGFCAVVWTRTEPASRELFPKGPPAARLARICAPGMGISELRRYCQERYPGANEVIGEGGRFHPEAVPEWFGELASYLQSYYATGLRDCRASRFSDNWGYWRERLDWSEVTPFQKQVLEVLAAIPRGERLTYGKVAARIGRPAAARAVGAAIGSNPWPVLIPCHRVIGTNGKLTGFSAPGGIGAKRRMLEMEDY